MKMLEERIDQGKPPPPESGQPASTHASDIDDSYGRAVSLAIRWWGIVVCLTVPVFPNSLKAFLTQAPLILLLVPPAVAFVHKSFKVWLVTAATFFALVLPAVALSRWMLGTGFPGGEGW